MRSILRLLHTRQIMVFGFAGLVFLALTDSGMVGANEVRPTVAAHTVSVVGATAQPGSQVTVAVELESGGDEVAGSFTLNFDPTKLSISSISSPNINPDVTIGTGVPPGTAITVNANQAASGRIGVLIDSSNSFTVSPPNRQIVRFRFTIAANAATGATPLTFGSTPTPRSFSDALGNPLTMSYVDGSITIQAPAPPVSVSGLVTTPTGQPVRNALVSVVDANSVRRIAATSQFGFYTVSNIPPGQNYTISVASRRWRFTPQNMMISSDLTGVNFVGQE